MSKKYTTFEELDKEIKRAWLQSEINREELKLSLYETKQSMTPGKIVTAFVGGMTTSAVVIKLVTPIASFAIAKFLRKYK